MTGKIIPNGVSLQKHENDTVVFFTERGFDVELIPTSHIEGQRTPDFIMSGLAWETKSPVSNKHRAWRRAFFSAVEQSCNVIFDFRRIKNYNGSEVKVLEKLFQESNKIKHLKIITETGKIIDLCK